MHLFTLTINVWVSSMCLLLLFNHKVVSNSLQPHGLQHTRLLCPPLSPKVWSNSCPLSQWCFLTISSSITPFSFCLQSFPASGSFPKSRLFTSGGQSIGASASASTPEHIADFIKDPSPSHVPAAMPCRHLVMRFLPLKERVHFPHQWFLVNSPMQIGLNTWSDERWWSFAMKCHEN